MCSIFWDKNITIYTPYNHEDTLSWYKYYVNNVFVSCSEKKNTDGNSYSDNNSTVIRIDKINYVEYNSWCNLSDEQKSKNVAISKESIIVIDKVSDEIEDNDSGSYLFDKYTCTKPIIIKNNLYQYLPHIYIVGD